MNLSLILLWDFYQFSRFRANEQRIINNDYSIVRFQFFFPTVIDKSLENKVRGNTWSRLNMFFNFFFFFFSSSFFFQFVTLPPTYNNSWSLSVLNDFDVHLLNIIRWNRWKIPRQQIYWRIQIDYLWIITISIEFYD